MNQKFPGALIKYRRLEKSWSQEGLCRGICTVSYLSKIESGKAIPGEELVSQLFSRLEVNWHASPKELSLARDILETVYSKLFSMEIERDVPSFWENRELLENGPFLLDWLLLSQLLKNETPSLPEAFLPVMDQRQYGLWLWGQGRFEELLKLYPTPFYFLMAGTEDFNKGDYSRAIERLERSYDLACQEGQAVMMLEAKMFLGGCYSAVGRFEQMQFHYKVAENLARALKDKDALESLRYNTAATALQLGRTEEAYAYFSSLSQPDALSCHKLAICCEKLRKPQEALNALSRAETAPCALDRGLVSDLCAPVRYRLEHPGSYLREEEYQKLLFHCFERVQKELHRGFALFHLEWMEEWYAANRQYKQAYELIREFSQL